jgi:hypothetical protein
MTTAFDPNFSPWKSLAAVRARQPGIALPMNNSATRTGIQIKDHKTSLKPSSASVVSFPRNDWSGWLGTGGQLASESVVGLARLKKSDFVFVDRRQLHEMFLEALLQ